MDWKLATGAPLGLRRPDPDARPLTGHRLALLLQIPVVVPIHLRPLEPDAFAPPPSGESEKPHEVSDILRQLHNQRGKLSDFKEPCPRGASCALLELRHGGKEIVLHGDRERRR